MAIWFLALSDLLINLSAGWFGAAIAIPLYTKKPKFKPWALIVNSLLGIVSLLSAVLFRSVI